MPSAFTYSIVHKELVPNGGQIVIEKYYMSCTNVQFLFTRNFNHMRKIRSIISYDLTRPISLQKNYSSHWDCYSIFHVLFHLIVRSRLLFRIFWIMFIKNDIDFSGIDDVRRSAECQWIISIQIVFIFKI